MQCGDTDDEEDLNFLADSLEEAKDQDDMDILFIPLIQRHFHKRKPCLFRKRWDSEYLVNLAVNEGSFVSEYRLDPGGFDILNDLLGPMIACDPIYARLSGSQSGSGLITTASRLGSALILLGGGRSMEAMRTHGLSESTVYANFHQVIEAINNHPALDIVCDNSLPELKKRSAQFMDRSTHDLFRYCTGIIDDLAIHIRAPSRDEASNQSRF